MLGLAYYNTTDYMRVFDWWAARRTWGVLASDGTTILAIATEYQGKPVSWIRRKVGEAAWQAAISDIPPPHGVAAPGPSAPLAVPPDRWPRRIRLLAKLRKPEDRGAGDTLARLIPAGEAFKAAYKRLTGKDCGCSARQAQMNAMYPYTALEA